MGCSVGESDGEEELRHNFIREAVKHVVVAQQPLAHLELPKK